MRDDKTIQAEEGDYRAALLEKRMADCEELATKYNEGDDILPLLLAATFIGQAYGENVPRQASQPIDAERIGVGEYVVRFGSQQRGEQPNVLMYEDELPNAMTTAEYDEWYKGSSVVDGVRMGPRFPSQPPSVTVDQIMEVVDGYFSDCRFTIPWDILPRSIIRSRLASLLNGQQKG